MTPIAYTVSATLPDEGTRDEYVRWLREGHLSDVVRGGALSGSVVAVIDPATPLRVEARYVFPSRQAYDRYVSEHAPALRAEGLSRFPPERGIRFQRCLGEVLA